MNATLNKNRLDYIEQNTLRPDRVARAHLCSFAWMYYSLHRSDLCSTTCTPNIFEELISFLFNLVDCYECTFVNVCFLIGAATQTGNGSKGNARSFSDISLFQSAEIFGNLPSNPSGKVPVRGEKPNHPINIWWNCVRAGYWLCIRTVSN